LASIQIAAASLLLIIHVCVVIRVKGGKFTYMHCPVGVLVCFDFSSR
jgi:hypothetical protein